MPRASLFPHFYFFFFNDTATTEIYTLSLHDALPIWRPPRSRVSPFPWPCPGCSRGWVWPGLGRSASSARRSCSPARFRSEEHTSELQSQSNLVCRLLLEKKKQMTNDMIHNNVLTPHS